MKTTYSSSNSIMRNKFQCTVLVVLIICLFQFSYAYGKGHKKEFTSLVDIDNTTLYFRRLPQLNSQVGTCYEMKKNNEKVNFCYPAIHIAGVAKCGTSAMYDFLDKQKGIIPANPDQKEYCLNSRTYFKYFKGFSNQASINGNIVVNGCIHTPDENIVHKILQPEAIYILMVRQLADREWASYNFWCNPGVDKDCMGGKWSKSGMYRSPELFHEMLLAAQYPLSTVDQYKCSSFEHFYKVPIERLTLNTGIQPFVMSSEAFSGPNNWKHVQNLQQYINKHLGTTIKLNMTHFHMVNTGDQKGSNSIATHATEGLYEMSGHRPILHSSYEYITGCWKECSYIAELAQYPYNCTLTSA